MKNKSQNSGFTLIEILVSLVIISIIGIVVVQTFLTTVRANTKAEAMREIKQNGDMVLSYLTRQIQSASAISGPPGSYNFLTITDSAGLYEYTYALDVKCQLTETKKLISTGVSDPATILTPSSVALKASIAGSCAISFVTSGTGSISERVTVSFPLMRATSSTAQIDVAVMQFQTTVTKRNVPR